MKATAETMIQGDRISLLPEPIIHHMMSLLPTRDAARASVLSHKWYSFWSTFPVININSSDFPYREVTLAAFHEMKNRFIDCLQQTLSHRSMKYLDMLRIKSLTFRNGEHYDLLDRLVEEAVEDKLKNLDLNLLCNVVNHIPNGPEACNKCYKVPSVVFSLGESLISLNLQGCDLVGYDQNLSVKFCLLKSLSITHTHVEAGFVEQVVRGSLAIESLELGLCYGLNNFSIAHKRMKKFVLTQYKHLAECKVDVPGLQSFEFTGYCFLEEVDQFNWIVLEFNLPDDAFMFPSLTCLYLKHVNTNAGTFNRIMSSFPKLKVITIKECDISARGHLVGNELIHVVIEDSVFEEKLECHAGNLDTVTFKHSYNILCYLRFTSNYNHASPAYLQFT